MYISKEFINKYNKPGPRYTSYPPATFFTSEFGDKEYKEKILLSNSENPRSISIYIHIPFCPHQCSFCACTTIIAQKRPFIERYMAALNKEINTVADLLDKDRLVTQIHWGGGTPNSIKFIYIKEVMDTIKKRFTFAPNIEIAMECSPSYLKLTDIDKLAEYGFNRVSLGVQDLKQEVLDVVNRRAPKVPIAESFARFREYGFTGINIDLIYGLPKQTKESFLDTVQKVIDMKPDRIVTFSYAHVPWLMKYQHLLEKVGLPSPEEKMEMLVSSLDLLTKSGYNSIGMDHYARPDDDISIALDNKKLHRNFQGYCTLETTGQVYGFGASSIGQLYDSYIQNEKNIAKYMDRIEKDDFAVVRGYTLTKAELLCRQVINEVMCNNFVDFEDIAKQFEISLEDVYSILEFEESKFDEFLEDGLIKITKNTLSVHPKGRLIVRNIAMKFDPALKVGGQVYSKTV